MDRESEESRNGQGVRGEPRWTGRMFGFLFHNEDTTGSEKETKFTQDQTEESLTRNSISYL